MTATQATSHSPRTATAPIDRQAAGWPAIPTVFYDGACPLCRREIAHYRRLRVADRLAWVDISNDQATLDAHGLSRQAAMERLHVRDAAGNWQTGAWAFAELWAHLPRYRLLSGLLRRTGALPLLDRAYTLFARWRLRRRCDSRDPAASRGRSGHCAADRGAAETKSHTTGSSSTGEGSCA